MTQFEKDILEGLSKQNKSLPSKYFYDEIGDELFVKIMDMPEYYLTNSEYEILSEQGDKILAESRKLGEAYHIFELGAGDGRKTIELLKKVRDSRVTYFPIDISKNALEVLKSNVKDALPNLKIELLHGDYFNILRELGLKSKAKKLVLFLGSNLGNMNDEEASHFLMLLANSLNKDDLVLLGLDLKKSKSIVLPAYNDAQGYTRDFNVNLLRRINKEMDGNFDLNSFVHVPEYDENEGVAYSYLKSTKDQKVYLSSVDQSFHFKKDELIHTEISRKYDHQKLEKILKGSSLEIKRVFTDQKNYFSNYLLKKIS